MTLSAFKQKAMRTTITLELLQRYGKTEFAPWLQGARPIVAVRSYGFDLGLLTTKGLSDPNQKTSELRVERAAQFELKDNILSIYDSGLRPATEAEQDAIDAWEKRCREKGCWGKKDFFRTFVSSKGKPKSRKNGYEYVLEARRYKIDAETGRELLLDKNVRGNLILQYRVAEGSELCVTKLNPA